MIVIECTKDQGKEIIYIISQLGMAGEWMSKPRKHSNFWIKLGYRKDDKYYHDLTLYLEDHRHFANITVCTDLSPIWKKHGPCLLTTALLRSSIISQEEIHPEQKIVSLEYWIKCLNNKRLGKEKMICSFLLEQKWMSSVGNYLRSETLYHAGILPQRTLRSLSSEEINRLYHSVLEILTKAYVGKGPNQPYYDSQRPCGDGSFKFSVYKQTLDPQGNHVIVQDFDGRSSYFVPQMQK